MNSLLVAVNAILPITVLILLGILIRRKGYIEQKSFKQFNWFVFHFLLPLNIFMNIVQADLRTIVDLRLSLYCLAVMLGFCMLSALFLRNVRIDDKKKGVFVQCMFRSNYIILGIPIVQSIYGDGSLGLPSFIAAWSVPFFNFLAILVLEHYSGEHADLKHTILKILKNPMIIASILGVLIQITKLFLPGLVMNVLSNVNKMCTPLALFVMGGLFEFRSLRDNMKLLSVITVLRLIVLPLVGLAGAILMGYRDVALISLLVLLGGPVGVSSYAMTVEMHCDGELAAQSILATTIFVLPTFMIFITAMGQLGYL